MIEVNCPNCSRVFNANFKGEYCKECWVAWSRNDGSYESRKIEQSNTRLSGDRRTV